jgi:hypothetical protein
MQPGRQSVGLVARFAIERDEFSGRERTSGEFFRDDAHLVFANDDDADQKRSHRERTDQKQASLDPIDGADERRYAERQGDAYHHVFSRSASLL